MINDSEWAAGTTTSSTAMSWLPVPRRPDTVQVSMMRTSLAGKSMSRESGIPLGKRRGPPPSITTLPPMSHAQCSHPLANGHRPDPRRGGAPAGVAMPFNTNGMMRGVVREKGGPVTIEVWKTGAKAPAAK